MDIRLLQTTASIRNQLVFYADFLIKLGEIEVILKGCVISIYPAEGLSLGIPKLRTEKKAIYSPFVFVKEQDLKTFKTKALEKIIEKFPELKDMRIKDDEDIERYRAIEKARADGLSALQHKKPNKRFKKPFKSYGSRHAHPKGAAQIQDGNAQARPKVDYGKFSDLPNRIQKPGRTALG